MGSIDPRKNWCQNKIGFVVKKSTSGFQVPIGSEKVTQAIARVELYKPPKVSSKSVQPSNLGGNSFAHIKTASKQNYKFKTINFSHKNHILPECFNLVRCNSRKWITIKYI